MLIVSQNQKDVVNLSAIEAILVSNENEIMAFGVNNDNEYLNIYTVAKYENESNAKSALKQLWSAYNNGEKVFLMP